MLTVDSFCRRVFAPRPTNMILYFLFIILSHPHPRPLSFHKKFPDIFCLPPIDKRPCWQYYNVNI